MYKTCGQIITQFNEMAVFLPTPLHNKIMEGTSIEPNECGDHFREVVLAVALWHEICRRVNEFPNYSQLLQ